MTGTLSAWRSFTVGSLCNGYSQLTNHKRNY